MPGEGVQRRLAAILAADIAGYSRLMGADEEGTFARLKALRREVMDPALADHHGRLVKLTGDGALVEFASAVDAVRCAVAIQQAIADRTREERADHRIALRIGVNLGDVIVDGDDLYGDGVNIAARLEALAEPGSVLISGGVHDQVGRRLAFRFEDLGTHRVKNIDEPLRVWRVVATIPEMGQRRALPAEPSVAVMPFAAHDSADEDLAQGITEDIISDLGRVPGLFVIAPYSAFACRARAADAAAAARELGVRYVHQGSVAVSSGRLQISGELTDTQSGGPAWAERYDRPRADLFAVQGEIAERIVEALAVRAPGEERTRLTPRRTPDLEAHALLLGARKLIFPPAAERLATAERMVSRAVTLDSGYAAAHAALAVIRSFQAIGYGGSGRPEALFAEAQELVRRAVALDPTLVAAHLAQAHASLLRGRIEEALLAARYAAAIEPGNADAHAILGFCHTVAGRLRDALAAIETALRLDPFGPSPRTESFVGFAQFMAGRYEDAIATLRRPLQRGETLARSPLALLAAPYALLGNEAEAEATVRRLRERYPSDTLANLALFRIYRRPEDVARLRDGLRRAGLPD